MMHPAKCIFFVAIILLETPGVITPSVFAQNFIHSENLKLGVSRIDQKSSLKDSAVVGEFTDTIPQEVGSINESYYTTGLYNGLVWDWQWFEIQNNNFAEIGNSFKNNAEYLNAGTNLILTKKSIRQSISFNLGGIWGTGDNSLNLPLFIAESIDNDPSDNHNRLIYSQLNFSRFLSQYTLLGLSLQKSLYSQNESKIDTNTFSATLNHQLTLFWDTGLYANYSQQSPQDQELFSSSEIGWLNNYRFGLQNIFSQRIGVLQAQQNDQMTNSWTANFAFTHLFLKNRALISTNPQVISDSQESTDDRNYDSSMYLNSSMALQQQLNATNGSNTDSLTISWTRNLTNLDEGSQLYNADTYLAIYDHVLAENKRLRFLLSDTIQRDLNDPSETGREDISGQFTFTYFINPINQASTMVSDQISFDYTHDYVNLQDDLGWISRGKVSLAYLLFF